MPPKVFSQTSTETLTRTRIEHVPTSSSSLSKPPSRALTEVVIIPISLQGPASSGSRLSVPLATELLSNSLCPSLSKLIPAPKYSGDATEEPTPLLKLNSLSVLTCPFAAIDTVTLRLKLFRMFPVTWLYGALDPLSLS